jgi:hypothetical protein
VCAGMGRWQHHLCGVPEPPAGAFNIPDWHDRVVQLVFFFFCGVRMWVSSGMVAVSFFALQSS